MSLRPFREIVWPWGEVGERETKESTASRGDASTRVCCGTQLPFPVRLGDAATTFTRGFEVRSQIGVLEPWGAERRPPLLPRTGLPKD